VPHGVYNRQAENQTPLLAIADASGGEFLLLALAIAQ
jgi:hypothetical protein